MTHSAGGSSSSDMDRTSSGCVTEARDLTERGVITFIDPGPEALPAIREADIGVLMTAEREHSEGCSNALMEYMACRLPVICTRGGGNPELVLDGATGYVIDAGSSGLLVERLRGLAEDPGLARRMGSAGRRRLIEQFSTERMVADLLACIAKSWPSDTHAILLVNSFYYPRGGDCVHVLALEKLLAAEGHEVAIFAMQHPENCRLRGRSSGRQTSSTAGSSASPAGVDAALPQCAIRAGRATPRLPPPRISTGRRAHARDPPPSHAVRQSRRPSATACPWSWTLHDYRTVCPATHCLRDGRPCERCAGARFWQGIVGRCKSSSLPRSAAAVAESYFTRLRGTLGLVDCYVAPSLFLADVVTRMGLPATRIEVASRTSIGLPRIAPPVSAERSGVLFVGRLSQEKGVHCLIEACVRENIALRVIGDGPLLEGCRSRSAGADVVFEGWQDEADVHRAMEGAEMLCVPSVCYENCPTVVLEAASSGLPVMASDLGGLRELLDHGRCGWLVTPGDESKWCAAMREALHDSATRQAFGERARRRLLKRHDPSRYVARLADVYMSCE